MFWTLSEYEWLYNSLSSAVSRWVIVRNTFQTEQMYNRATHGKETAMFVKCECYVNDISVWKNKR